MGKPALTRTARFTAAVAALAILSTLLAMSGCAAPSHEGFAIYFPAEDPKASEVKSVSDLHPAGDSLVALKDIVSYNGDTHRIELTPEAFARLDDAVGAAKVPTWGKVFVVCVDRKPVYWGAFWPMYSSASFDGITIQTPLGINLVSPGETIVPNSIQIGVGYPSSGFYQGEDPRSDPAIVKSLRDAGKLK